MRPWSKEKKVIDIPSSSGISEDYYENMNKKIGLNNITVTQKPNLIIDTRCFSHIRALHSTYPHTEWLAICKVINEGNWTFRVVDMIHPEQYWVGWEVETTDKGMDWCVSHLIERWENLWDWNLVMHSHHTMWCFWSTTDDNARKWLNDWRTLAWAVVTSYRDNPDTWEICFKWCVNFYKPYNIEIDADVTYEDTGLYNNVLSLMNSDDDYKKELEAKEKEIFEQKSLEAKEEIKNSLEPQDYSNLIWYLGIDIGDVLKENYVEVAKKMGNATIDDIVKRLKDEAKNEALEQIAVPEGIELDEATTERLTWSNELLEQLKNARVSSKGWFPSVSSTKTWKEFEFSKTFSSKPVGFTSTVNWQDEDDLDSYSYWNQKNFPTVEDIKAAIYQETWIANAKFLLAQSGKRLIYTDEFGCFQDIDEFIGANDIEPS